MEAASSDLVRPAQAGQSTLYAVYHAHDLAVRPGVTIGGLHAPPRVGPSPLDVLGQRDADFLVSVDHDLAIVEPVFPEEELYLTLGREGHQVRLWKRIAPVAMDRMVFVKELDRVAADLDEPPVMTQTGEARVFPSPRALGRARWHLDVSAFADADHLRAYPERIAEVFECVRAIDEIDRLVSEGEGLAAADVAPNPRLGGEGLFRRALIRDSADGLVVSSRIVGLGVEDVVGAIERTGPRPDIEHDVVRTKRVQHALNVRCKHDAVQSRRGPSRAQRRCDRACGGMGPVLDAPDLGCTCRTARHRRHADPQSDRDPDEGAGFGQKPGLRAS